MYLFLKPKAGDAAAASEQRELILYRLFDQWLAGPHISNLVIYLFLDCVSHRLTHYAHKAHFFVNDGFKARKRVVCKRPLLIDLVNSMSSKMAMSSQKKAQMGRKPTLLLVLSQKEQRKKSK